MEELIRTWERPLLYFIRRLVHDEADAWDVLQKTWVQVLSGISAAEQLLPLVYDELRKLAAQKLAQEKPGQTLQATALVHEAYLRLVGVEKAQQWDSRGHFFAAAAEAMRRILVDNARRKRRPKHGGDRKRLDLDAAAPIALTPADDLVELDEALSRLERTDAVAARLVKLRYFAGLSMPQAAEALGMPLRTTERNWTYAPRNSAREFGSGKAPLNLRASNRPRSYPRKHESEVRWE